VIRGLMTDDEWATFEPFLITPPPQGWRPPSDHRQVLDGILWIARTAAPWRDLPAQFGNWNSVWRQFRRWCQSGVWDVLLRTLADSGGHAGALQMIDGTTVRAHRRAAGERGRFKIRHSAVRAWVHHQDPSPPERHRLCHWCGVE
jgi:transposase